jgi:hypothetical protein
MMLFDIEAPTGLAASRWTVTGMMPNQRNDQSTLRTVVRFHRKSQAGLNRGWSVASDAG